MAGDKSVTDQAKNSRDTRIDFVKGVMIGLMVLFHYDPLPQCTAFFAFFDRFSVSFFLPIFFVLTGYFTKADDFGRCIKISLLHLGTPYIMFSVVYMSMIWLGQHGFYPIRQEVELSSPLNWLYILSFKTITPYYYLYEVLLFRIIIAMFNKYILNKNTFWLTVFLFLMILDWSGVVISHWPWLFLGYVMSVLRIQLFWGWVSFVPVVVLVAMGFFSTSKTLNEFIYSLGFYERALWVLCILSLTGYFGETLNWGISRAVKFVGRNSLAILVMHIFGLKLALFARKFSLSDSAILDFILMFICGVVLPILCAKVMDLMKVSWLFFGRKEAFVQ